MNATSSTANSQTPWRRVIVRSSRSISHAIPRHSPSTAADVSSVTDNSAIIAIRAAVPPRTAVDRSLRASSTAATPTSINIATFWCDPEAPDVERVVAVSEVGLADAEAEHARPRQQDGRDGEDRDVNRLPPGGEQCQPDGETDQREHHVVGERQRERAVDDVGREDLQHRREHVPRKVIVKRDPGLEGAPRTASAGRAATRRTGCAARDPRSRRAGTGRRSTPPRRRRRRRAPRRSAGRPARPAVRAGCPAGAGGARTRWRRPRSTGRG